MGFGSPWHWIIVLVVVILVFGTSKLRNVGRDLGGAIKDFKKGMNENNQDEKNKNNPSISTTASQDSTMNAHEEEPVNRHTT